MTESKDESVVARLARSVIEWLDVSGMLTAQNDLILLRLPTAFRADAIPAEVVATSGAWKLAHVGGDLALRVALTDASGAPLLAFTSHDETVFQEDLRERAVLRRAIAPQSRHIFNALVGIESTALDDERYGAALRDVFDGGRRDRLLAAIKTRTWLHLVRDTDADAVLCAAAFGFDDRYAEQKPGELWASWLQDPPLATPALTAIASEVLRSRYPHYATLLANASHTDVRDAFTRVSQHTFARDPVLTRLAHDTAKILRERDAGLLAKLLAESEAAYVAAGSPELPESMLANAAAAKTRLLLQSIRSEEPPATERIDELSRFVYGDLGKRDALVRLARFARGLRFIEQTAYPTIVRGFADVFRDDIAWLDRVARRTREIAIADIDFADTQKMLVDRWYALRDRWNAEFARLLASEWSKLFAFPGKDAPVVVSDVLKYHVRPELATRRTLLVVLDGCDIPTFLEIASAFSTANVLSHRFDVALSAIPTVTSHARRAIFGGGIPNDKIGDEDRAADALGDVKAFNGKNAVLDGYSRRLFLKGDLGDGGTSLVSLLEDIEHAPQLVAVVFNDVDDAIASKEHAVLPERTLERCTKAFREALISAYESGWRIVLTADHGHTPYRQPDVKATTEHPRFSLLAPTEAAPAGTVVFDTGIGMPYRVAALHQLGSHSGPQHVGYHGGASLEEMLVPLAIFDKGATPTQAVLPPPWWDEVLNLPKPRHAEHALLAPPKTDATSLRARIRAALTNDPNLLAIFDRIYEAGALDSIALGSVLRVPPARVRISVTGLIAKLRGFGIESPIEIEESPLVFRYRGER